MSKNLTEAIAVGSSLLFYQCTLEVLRKIVMKFRPVLLFALLSFSTNAFAVCEHERREYREWSDRCDNFTAASNATRIGGALLGLLFTIPTCGMSLSIGGLAGAAPGFAADNACRIKDEKKHNLENCEERARAENDAELFRVHIEGLIAQAIERATHKFNKNINNLSQNAQARIDQVWETAADEGYDLDDPETQAVLAEEVRGIEQALQAQIQELEQEYRETAAFIRYRYENQRSCSIHRRR